MVDETTGADVVEDVAEPAAIITSRFLPRVERNPAGPQKLERLAMEEVRRRVIPYTLPTGYDGKGTE